MIKDLKKHKDMPALLHTNSKNFFMTYPQLMSAAAQSFVRVDGTPKIEKERATISRFVKTRSRLGMVSDAVKLAFAWR